MKVFEVEHGSEREEAEEDRLEPDPAEQVHGALGVSVEEADQEQVKDDVEGAAETVLGPPSGTGTVIDDNLGNARALPGGENRDEPVHLTVEPDSFEHTPPVQIVAFSPDGRHLAAGNMMVEVGVWDLESGARVAPESPAPLRPLPLHWFRHSLLFAKKPTIERPQKSVYKLGQFV